VGTGLLLYVHVVAISIGRTRLPPGSYSHCTNHGHGILITVQKVHLSNFLGENHTVWFTFNFLILFMQSTLNILCHFIIHFQDKASHGRVYDFQRGTLDSLEHHQANPTSGV